MSTEKGRLGRIVDALRRNKDDVPKRHVNTFSSKTLEQLASFSKQKSVSLEERIPRNDVLMKRNEVLYRLDPLVWSGVNKLSRLISSPRIYFSGSTKDDVVVMEMFVDHIGLRPMLPHLIKDIFVYGYGVAEKVKRGNKIERLAQIDPKTFDYQRIEGTDYIARNADGSIKGYRQELVGTEDKTFKPEDVIILKFYTLGEECLGLTPIEVVFKSSWIKINLMEALGEAVYRHGYPIYYYKIGTAKAEDEGFEITPEKIKEAKQYLVDLSSASELVLPWWIEPGRLDANSQIGDISNFLQYLSAEIMTGLEVPKVYGTATTEVRGNVSQEVLDFESTIKSMQNMAIVQLYEQLFKDVVLKSKMEYPYPQLTFIEHNEETKMLKSRRLAQYAKYNIITPDASMEDDVRQTEGVPTKKEGEAETQCVFGYGDCPIRKDNKIPLDELAKFCPACPKNKKEKPDEPEPTDPEIIDPKDPTINDPDAERDI